MKQYSKQADSIDAFDNHHIENEEPFGSQYVAEVQFYQEVFSFENENKIENNIEISSEKVKPGMEYIAKLYKRVEEGLDAWLVFERGKRTLSDRLFALSNYHYVRKSGLGHDIFAMSHQKLYQMLATKNNTIIKDLINIIAKSLLTL